MSRVKTCQVCHHQNTAGAAECVHCGAPLAMSDTIRIRDIMPEDEASHQIARDVDLPRGKIALYVYGQIDPLLIDVRDRVVVGRLGTGVLQSQFVDLQAYHAGLLGVSRQHVAIAPSENGYVVSDLNSSNGTWVNGEQLSPHSPHPLKNGDRLRLGELVTFVYIGSV